MNVNQARELNKARHELEKTKKDLKEAKANWDRSLEVIEELQFKYEEYESKSKQFEA